MKEKKERIQLSIKIDREIYKAFKSRCALGEAPVNKTIEAIMSLIIENKITPEMIQVHN